ncbi:MAG: ABC transporter permease [Methanosarcinales archaeon]|nr:ABC transporter permease [Methanosarcinales archaeon]
MKFHIIAAKDMKILIRDHNALILMFILPMLLISVAGLALGGTFEDNIRIDVLVVDLDNRDLSKEFVQFLEDIDILDVDMESNEFAARDRVKNKEYGRLVIVPPGFTESIMTGQDTELLIISDPSEDSQNTVLEKIIEGYANRMSTYVVTIKTVTTYGVPTYDQEKVFDIIKVVDRFIASPPVAVVTQSSTTDTKDFSPFIQYVPGFAVMFLLLTCVEAGSVSLLKEQESGTLRRLVTAPISRSEIIGGKIASIFIRGFIQLSVLLLFGQVVFDLNLGSSIAAIIILISAVTLAGTGFGMLVAVLVKTKDQASSLSSMLVLTMSAMGGSWWPLFIEPQFMQDIAHFTITAWAMDGFYDLLIFDTGVSGIMKEVGVLLLMSMIFFWIATTRFKFE